MIADAVVAPDVSLRDLVEAVRAIPYGRPRERTVDGMLREQRGTCSTKHLFLARVLAECFPGTAPRIIHRVYTLNRTRARELFGSAVAATVPNDGLIDVHRYLAITLGGERVEIDVTFPGPAWDGRSPLALVCGAGTDFPAGDDPDAEKRALEERHCDLAVRSHSLPRSPQRAATRCSASVGLHLRGRDRLTAAHTDQRRVSPARHARWRIVWAVTRRSRPIRAADAVGLWMGI